MRLLERPELWGSVCGHQQRQQQLWFLWAYMHSQSEVLGGVLHRVQSRNRLQRLQWCYGGRLLPLWKRHQLRQRPEEVLRMHLNLFRLSAQVLCM